MRLISLIFFIMFSTLVGADSFFNVDPKEEWTYTLAYNVFTNHYLADGYELKGEVISFQENNKLTGVRINFSDTFGGFFSTGENSYYENTTMIGIELQLDNPPEFFDFGVDLGIGTGYEVVVSSGNMPFFNPFIRFNQGITQDTYVSFKAGNLNMMVINAFVEVTTKF